MSNARRIGFTALAVATFVCLDLAAYWISRDAAYERMPGDYGVVFSFEAMFLQFEYVLRGASMALIPLGLLLLSTSNSVLRLPSPRVVVSGALILASMILSGLLGHADAMTCIHAHYSAEHLGDYYRERHALSWLWLLLPITITTAFVIFGACRRAVRDAEMID